MSLHPNGRRSGAYDPSAGDPLIAPSGPAPVSPGPDISRSRRNGLRFNPHNRRSLCHHDLSRDRACRCDLPGNFSRRCHRRRRFADDRQPRQMAQAPTISVYSNNLPSVVLHPCRGLFHHGATRFDPIISMLISSPIRAAILTTLLSRAQALRRAYGIAAEGHAAFRKSAAPFAIESRSSVSHNNEAVRAEQLAKRLCGRANVLEGFTMRHAWSSLIYARASCKSGIERDFPAFIRMPASVFAAIDRAWLFPAFI